MIELACPHCGEELVAEDNWVGKKVRCPTCGGTAGVASAPSRPAPPVGSETATMPPAGPPSFDAAETATVPPSGPAPEALAAPADVSGYEILGELGRGGMGVVYRARQKKLGRVVALKMILAGAHAGEAELARFRTEAEAIARLQHPNIVQVFEVDEQHGLPYFSLEFCPGGSLEKKLAGTPLPPKEAAALVEALARAMDAAHRKGVIHRDLKPANVLLAEDGTPKVTDFGLAKKLDEAGRTATGAVMGTPSYMAPEQAGRGDGAIGPAVDIYALGALLYVCLTGRPPFKATTALDTLMQVLSDEPVPPARLSPTVPRDLETVCLKCLHKEPRKRYATARELADDLRRFQAGEPVRARASGLWERGWKWVRRRPAAAALIGVSAAATVTLFAVILAANARLQRERDHARRQEELATRERDRAEANFKRAGEAVSQLTEVAEKELRGVPRLEATRRRLLEKALRLYQELAQQKGNDPAGRFEVAQANQRVGDIQASLGLYAEAGRAFQEATHLLEGLTAEDPDNADYLNALAIALHEWATDLRAVMPPDQMVALLRRAIDIKARLVAAFPAAPNYRQNLASGYNNLGNVLQNLGRPGEAAAALEQSRQISEKLAADYPDEPHYQSGLARTYHSLGVLLDLGGDPAAAEGAFRKAAELDGDLAKRFPQNHEYRQDLARHYNSLGIVLGNLGRTEDAATACEQSVALKEQVAADFPQVELYQAELANSYHILGNVHVGAGHPAKAAEALHKAVAIYERLVKEHPDSPHLTTDLAGTCCDQGRQLAHEGKYADALPWYDRAVRTLDDVLKSEPRQEKARRFLFNALDGRSHTLRELKRDDDARRDEERAARLQPGRPQAP